MAFSEITTVDALALVAFLVVWFGYEVLFDSRWRFPGTINANMIRVREAWMRRLLRRDGRIVDSTLIGYSIRSATFFASTTILLIAGLVGVIGSAERLHGMTSNLSLLLRQTSQGLFEVKVLLLVALLVYAFFKFTWAIRQFNYFAGIVGSAPEPRDGEPSREAARRMALVLSQAMWQVNAGVRGYYFAFAALGWFVHPALFVALSLLMAGIMTHRQLYSETARAIAAHVALLGALEDGGEATGGGTAPTPFDPPPPGERR